MRLYITQSLFLSLLLVSFLFNCQRPRQSDRQTLPATPEESLKTLVEGNRRFVNNQPLHPHQSHQRISETENGQRPFAVVVTCSDSRVSPEIIFDEGIGDLFVIRTAGNLLSDLELGSIEYAVEHLHTNLAVVLGHTECGAVKAFLEGGECQGHIRQIVESLADEQEEQQILKHEGKDLLACIKGNVLHGVTQIKEAKPILSEKIEEGALMVVPMLYDVHTGAVSILREDELRSKCHVASDKTVSSSKSRK